MEKGNRTTDKRILPHMRYPENFKMHYYAAILNRLPIAIWRLPNSREQCAVVNFDGAYSRINLDLNDAAAGFVLTPFFSQEENTSVFIEGHLYLQNSTAETFLANNENGHSRLLANKSRYEQTVDELSQAFQSKNNGLDRILTSKWFAAAETKNIPSVSNDDYCQWVEKAVASIRRTELEKVVISRCVEYNLRQHFDPFVLYHKLCCEYPNAFISLVAIPEMGTWIGATPELLISVSDEELMTVALAGTRSVEKTNDKDWGKKELVEQAIVSDYIRECFRQQGIADFKEAGPTTVQIGNLLHLKTQFGYHLAQNRRQIDINRFLTDLHPTPAVCGVPKMMAYRFIQEMETHDRELYAGFLGPVNLHGHTQLFVNLRCLQLLPTSAILYAGSGITEDSIPEKEGVETELKLKALLNILNSKHQFQGSVEEYSESISVTDRVLCDDQF
ncbi:MAG: isochorismate synthase [bacterium]